MKSPANVLVAILLTVITLNLHAQPEFMTSNRYIDPINIDDGKSVTKKGVIENTFHNFIKINLAALLFKSYALQYERTLGRNFSLAVQYRIMPVAGISFKGHVLKLMADGGADTKRIIDDFKVSNYAITPEVRLYLSRKGYGRGFYIAPFYRYASFTSHQLNVFYRDDNKANKSINLSGNLTSNTYGLAIGAQNALGKHLVIDWSLLGPHFGTAKGTFTGTPSSTLSPGEQTNVRMKLEDICFPLSDWAVNVDANKASMNIDGPWAGMRVTVGLGVRF
jgi:hypothetical protein